MKNRQRRGSHPQGSSKERDPLAKPPPASRSGGLQPRSGVSWKRAREPSPDDHRGPKSPSVSAPANPQGRPAYRSHTFLRAGTEH